MNNLYEQLKAEKIPFTELEPFLEQVMDLYEANVRVSQLLIEHLQKKIEDQENYIREIVAEKTILQKKLEAITKI
jgi:hypothetical protein